MGKCRSISERKHLPTLASTFLAVRRIESCYVPFTASVRALWLRGPLVVLLLSASWYVLFALSKHSLSDDISQRRLLIDSGMFLKTVVGLPVYIQRCISLF